MIPLELRLAALLYHGHASDLGNIMHGQFYFGSDEKTLFSSTSLNMFINIVNDKLMIIDFTRSPLAEDPIENPPVMLASIIVMNLDGSGMEILPQ